METKKRINGHCILNNQKKKNKRLSRTKGSTKRGAIVSEKNVPSVPIIII
tara:strand:- start:834 stop:983 length:150 start_codon:yes stop_codon:yes gene_type:complete